MGISLRETRDLFDIEEIVEFSMEESSLNIEAHNLTVVEVCICKDDLHAGHLMTGAYVSTKSIPSHWLNPCATSLAFSLLHLMDPSGLYLWVNVQWMPMALRSLGIGVTRSNVPQCLRLSFSRYIAANQTSLSGRVMASLYKSGALSRL